MRRKVLGFTLIELMIVVAIIAIIAAIAIPGLLRARISANEGSASAGLRSLASAQVSFMKAGSVDQDNDGTGEFGVINELTGATNRRGSLLPNTAAELPALTTTDMSVALQTNANGFSSKSGYYTRIWLPGPVGGPVVNDQDPSVVVALAPLDAAAITDDPAIQQQENRWIALSWPATYRSSGVRAFCADVGAEVFASSNTDPALNVGYFFGDVNSNGQEPEYNTPMMLDSAGNIPAPDETVWTNIMPKDNQNVCDANHTWLPTGS